LTVGDGGEKKKSKLYYNDNALAVFHGDAVRLTTSFFQTPRSLLPAGEITLRQKRSWFSIFVPTFPLLSLFTYSFTFPFVRAQRVPAVTRR